MVREVTDCGNLQDGGSHNGEKVPYPSRDNFSAFVNHRVYLKTSSSGTGGARRALRTGGGEEYYEQVEIIVPRSPCMRYVQHRAKISIRVTERFNTTKQPIEGDK